MTTPQSQAEWRRLQRALDEGPGRRIAADILANRPLAVADLVQRDSYQRMMLAISEGRA